jgi:lipopolysaccharide biosynthesis glycosyltransferase
MKLPELPLIIHFSGSSKPWHYLNEHPYKSEYWKYLQLTDYKNIKFEKITPKKILKKFWRRFKNNLSKS